MKELIEEEMRFLNEIINESRSGLLDSASLRLKCAKRLKSLQKAKQQPELSAEEILEKSAKKNMIEWNQKSFKRTHRLLHISIIQAINEALNLHNISQVNRIVCPNCGDHGWIYNEDATSRKTCPCHY